VSARLLGMSIARSAAEAPDPSGPCQCEACLDTGEAVTGSYCFCKAGEDAEAADEWEADEPPREAQKLTVAEFGAMISLIRTEMEARERSDQEGE